jgi:hypothetical protein
VQQWDQGNEFARFQLLIYLFGCVANLFSPSTSDSKPTGSAISLSIVPSANGGPFTVQVDAGTASNLNSKNTPAVNQCIPSQVFSQDNMEDKPHLIFVTNGATAAGSTAGTLEFNGIT